MIRNDKPSGQGQGVPLTRLSSIGWGETYKAGSLAGFPSPPASLISRYPPLVNNSTTPHRHAFLHRPSHLPPSRFLRRGTTKRHVERSLWRPHYKRLGYLGVRFFIIAVPVL